MATMNVQIVAVDREVWSGESDELLARTVTGEIGILPGHWNHLSVLVEGGVVDIRQGEQSTLAAVHGGFLLVHNNEVRVLAETAELGSEVDVERARSALQRSRAGDDADEEIQHAVLRAEARLRAAGQSP
jgi:F-type H+-transporting ATPase subunit epsilon